MKIALAADHGGFRLKEIIKKFLEQSNVGYEDFGCYDEESCDYIDWGGKAAEKVSKDEFKRAILICGTGVGMSIIANKFPGVRAVACYDLYATRQSREHNDCNVLVLGGRMTGEDLAKEIVKEWLTTELKTEERYKRRLEKIRKLEAKNFK